MIDKELGERAGDENIIEGRNAVNEALNAGRPIDKVYYNTDSKDGAFKSLVMRIKETGAAAIGCDRKGSLHEPHGRIPGHNRDSLRANYNDVGYSRTRKAPAGRRGVICDEIGDPII